MKRCLLKLKNGRKKINQKKKKVEVETIEEVKEPAVAEKDTTVTAETTEVSEPSDSGDGDLASQEPKPLTAGDILVKRSEIFAETRDQLDDTRKYKKRYETVVKKGELYSPEQDPFEYKFEINPEGQLDYYYKPKGSEDFILQEDIYASAKIAEKLKHLDEKQLKKP